MLLFSFSYAIMCTLCQENEYLIVSATTQLKLSKLYNCTRGCVQLDLQAVVLGMNSPPELQAAQAEACIHTSLVPHWVRARLTYILALDLLILGNNTI